MCAPITVYKARIITRAAARVDIGSPAVSHNLACLRELFGELLTRGSDGTHLAPCAKAPSSLGRHRQGAATLDKGGLTAAQKDNFIEGAETGFPLGRTGTAVEVAAAALYLAADATHTTDAELFVDDGLIDL
jgi:NAD(P)-dependent dehydrogenase (short-subunit alcohol dehydrogenase family)